MREPYRIPDLSDVAPYERFYGRYLYPASSFHMGDVLDHSCITALAPNCLSALRLFSINQVSLVLLSPAYYSDSYGLIACSLVILAWLPREESRLFLPARTPASGFLAHARHAGMTCAAAPDDLSLSSNRATSRYRPRRLHRLAISLQLPLFAAAGELGCSRP